MTGHFDERWGPGPGGWREEDQEEETRGGRWLFQCPFCTLQLSRRDNLRRHLRTVHQYGAAQTFYCRLCSAHLSRSDHCKRHLLNVHNIRLEGNRSQTPRPPPPPSAPFEPRRPASPEPRGPANPEPTAPDFIIPPPPGFRDDEDFGSGGGGGGGDDDDDSSGVEITEITSDEEPETRNMAVNAEPCDTADSPPAVSTPGPADCRMDVNRQLSPDIIDLTNISGDEAMEKPVPTPIPTPTRSGPRSLPCPYCGKVFKKTFNLSRHLRHICPARRHLFLPGSRLRCERVPTPQPSTSSATEGGGAGAPAAAATTAYINPSSVSSSYSNDSSCSNCVSGEGSSEIPVGIVTVDFEEVETAFRGRLKTYRLKYAAPSGVTIPEFLTHVFEEIVSLLRQILEHVTSVKVNLWLDCEFVNIHEQKCRRAFKTSNVAVFRSTDLETLFSALFQKLVDEKEACEMKGSGWSFLRIMDMEIRVNVYRPLGGSSFIPLPQCIASKKAVVNVTNTTDQMCFKYAILSKFIPNANREMLNETHFTRELERDSNLNFGSLIYPVQLEQIPMFERNNPGVSVNVYGLDRVRSRGAPVVGQRNVGGYEYITYPLRVVDRELDNHFDLLFLTNDHTTHYALITDFERLVRRQMTEHHDRLFICKRCFTHFDNRANVNGERGEQRLAEHRRYCMEHAPVRTDLSPKKTLTFNKYERTQRVRFSIYADFECALVPVTPQNVSPTTVPAPEWDPAIERGELPHHHHHHNNNVFSSDRVRTKSVHKPYAYAYFVKDLEHEINRTTTMMMMTDEDNDNGGNTFSVLRLYRGEDAAHHFMESIKRDVLRIGDLLYGQNCRRRSGPRLTAQQEAEFQAATVCYICSRPFVEGSNDYKVRDHRHTPPYTYRGPAHKSCNIQYKEQDTIHCYFHNLSNYDAHFVVRELAIDSGDVNVLANTEERYISFTKFFKYPGANTHNALRVRFVDSYRFLSKSLSALVEKLPHDKFVETRKFFPEQESFQLVSRKGVFPYEYVSSLEVLNENALPPRETFRNSLRNEDISQEDYAHAQRLWTHFDCNTLGDYAEVYLKTDVLLLTDVFEGFRDQCMEHYGLDPAHWLTLPSYAWDVMMFKTGVTLDTLQDIDMYLFFEKGIRGGLTQCVTRHAVADNKYTRRHQQRQEESDADVGGSGSGIDSTVDDDEREGDYIMYYDANNLYGWAMSQPLPYAKFEWLSQDDINGLDIAKIPADGEYGYVFEVDLEYPRDHNLHDRHRDLPFCPEIRKAPREQLPYSEEVLREFGAGRSAKLMVTLDDKDEYVIHYRLLQQAMENGLRLRRVCRVLRFLQKPWLKPYVALNTELRRNAKNQFEVELFKLMVNAVYGMSLQNVRKHINIKLATNPRTYTKYVAKSNFSDRTWYAENLALLHMRKVRIVLDKPVYAGMCILDHSKWWMYGFHYDCMQRRYGLDRIRLMYMDTDGLVYRIRTVDVYRDMLEHKDDFDTSNYPRDHMCYDPTNARVLGKFKDEAAGAIMKEFIGLMSKLYCFAMLDAGSAPVKRAKGVNRAVVAKGLTIDDYRRCLQEQRVKYTENERFQTRHHVIYTVIVSKRSLAPYDDKRYIEADGVNTLPWGHYAIPQQQQQQHFLPAALPVGIASTSGGGGETSSEGNHNKINTSPSATMMDVDDNTEDNDY